MGVIETAKDVVRLVQKLDNIELTNTILTLQGQIMELLESNQGLRNDVLRLEEQVRFKGMLWFAGGAYWHEDEQFGTVGPFCSKCWEDERKVIRERELAPGQFKCPKCGAFRAPLGDNG